MKTYSITRRLIVLVLTIELVLAAGTTTISLLYERHQHLRTFDMMLRGRADSLFGAVQDAENEADDVTLDPKALDLQPADMYEVRQDSGRVVAHSPHWDSQIRQILHDGRRGTSFRIHGSGYRGIVIHGVRQIDQEGSNPGISRPVTILYAASLEPVEEALGHAAKFLLISNSLLLLATGITLMILMRRGTAPLRDLEHAAAAISTAHWEFRAPASVHGIAELSVLARALEAAMERVQASFHQQQRFLHDAAHELKTAVTIVKSSMQLLSSRPRSANEYAEGLRLCMSDLARLEELVQRMLMLARLEQPRQEEISATGETNLNECLRQIQVQLAPFAQLREIDLQFEAEGSMIAPIPQEEFTILATNLAMNALQHTPPRGRVSLILEALEGGIRFEVTDTGEGIPAQDLPHIFDRFYRGDLSRSRKTGGTGLGLAICKAIAEIYGGGIAITSAMGSGTRVTVSLPRENLAMRLDLQETFSEWR